MVDLTWQCALADVSRATVYVWQKPTWTVVAGPLTTFLWEQLWRSAKHEDAYLNRYATMGEILVGLSKYFIFYNGERPHQALKNQTPDAVHQSAIGGGAMILGKYGAVERLPIALRSTGTALDKARVRKSAIPNAKIRGSLAQLCVKSSATYTEIKVVLTQGPTLVS
jgi:Integrase core domain